MKPARLPFSLALISKKSYRKKKKGKTERSEYSMQETKQEDARIYVVSTIFFACVVAGGTFLCLYMFRPVAESAPWYPVLGIILVGIPWMFWIGTYLYRCCEHCCCQCNGGNVSRVHTSSTKTSQSYGSAGHVARSMHSSENESSPLKLPDGNHRHVHFGEVVVLGSGKYNRNDHAQQQYPENEENCHDSIASDMDYTSAASTKDKASLIMSS